MVHRTQLWFLTLILFCSPVIVWAQAFNIQKSKLILRMKHIPLGRFDTLAEDALSGGFVVKEGRVQTSQGSILFKVASLNSLVPLRDEHMKKEHLQVDRYPHIELQNLQAQSQSGQFNAFLKVKELRRPIQGSFSVTEVEIGNTFPKITTTKADVSFTSKLSDFGISPPKYMGVGVKDEFEVIVELWLER